MLRLQGIYRGGVVLLGCKQDYGWLNLSYLISACLSNLLKGHESRSDLTVAVC